MPLKPGYLKNHGSRKDFQKADKPRIEITRSQKRMALLEKSSKFKAEIHAARLLISSKRASWEQSERARRLILGDGHCFFRRQIPEFANLFWERKQVRENRPPI
jgi:hypothetical protein